VALLGGKSSRQRNHCRLRMSSGPNRRGSRKSRRFSPDTDALSGQRVSGLVHLDERVDRRPRAVKIPSLPGSVTFERNSTQPRLNALRVT
jgi:hypothetical protein